MVLQEYQHMYRCTLIKERYLDDDSTIEEHYEDFSDIQMAYLWMKNDLGFDIPHDRNISEINGYECMSFLFMTDVLNLNTRREGFNFGVIPVMSTDVSYILFYKRST